MKPLEKIIDSLEENIFSLKDGDPFFSDRRYIPYPLSDKNFHAIEPSEQSFRLSFIDAGSAELISGPNFSISLLRMYFNIFDGSRRAVPAMPHRYEFYVLVHPRMKDDEVHYRAEAVPLASKSIIMDDVEFSSNDPTLKEGVFTADISKVAGAVRRFFEWRLAEEVVRHELRDGDVIVKDGTLQSSVTGESGYANKAYDAALEKSVFFTGLAKTSTLFTTTGNSLLAVLNRRGRALFTDSCWCYHPVADIRQPDHRAEMLVARLHKNSRHVFRYEILKEQFSRQAAEKIVSALAGNSCDYRFPGYPYGLIDADNFARVTEGERLYHKSLLMPITQRLSDDVAASDAHEILNAVVR